MKRISFVLVSLLMAQSVAAHGGKTDANGCHMDSKTGVQHCHTHKGTSSKKSQKAVSSKPKATSSKKAVAVPTDCSIKGNVSAKKEKIYHLPGCGSYKTTVIDLGAGERMFCSEEEAKKAGWRKAGNC